MSNESNETKTTPRYTDTERAELVEKFNTLAPQVGKNKAAKQLGVSYQAITNWMAKDAAANKKALKKSNPPATNAPRFTPQTITETLTSPVQSVTGNGKVLVILGEATCVQEMLKTALERLMN